MGTNVTWVGEPGLEQYNGFDGDKPITINEGGSVSVSDDKAEQLKADFPHLVSVDGAPPAKKDSTGLLDGLNAKDAIAKAATLTADELDQVDGETRKSVLVALDERRAELAEADGEEPAGDVDEDA